MQISNILFSAYPIVSSNKHALRNSFWVGFFVFLFLYTFQPFQLNIIETNKIVILCGYGVIAFVITFIGLTIQRFIVKEASWTTWKQIAFYMALVKSISLANFFYTRSYNAYMGLSVISFLFYTASIAIFPIVFLSFGMQRRLEKKHIEQSKTINKKLQDKRSQQSLTKAQLNINTTEKLPVSINQSSILFIESDGNYLVIHQLINNGVKSHKTRGTITKILEELNTELFQKTHRAYIVNLHHVKQAEGNAQGLKLHFHKSSLHIPVSRNHVRSVKERLIH